MRSQATMMPNRTEAKVTANAVAAAIRSALHDAERVDADDPFFPVQVLEFGVGEAYPPFFGVYVAPIRPSCVDIHNNAKDGYCALVAQIQYPEKEVTK